MAARRRHKQRQPSTRKGRQARKPGQGTRRTEAGRPPRDGPASRGEVLRLLQAGGGRPWSLHRLTARLGIRSGSPGAKALRRLLRELENEGLAERFDGQVRVLRADGLIEGEYQRRGRDGGEVVDPVGRALRIHDAGSARSGDRVLALPLGRGRGEIVQLVSPEAQRVVGRLVVDPRRAVVEAYGRGGPRDLRVARDDRGEARDGEMVEAVPARRGHSPQRWARIARRLGRPGEPGADFEALAWKHRLAVDFPPDVLREAERAARRADEAGERRDLTALPFVTIDPVSARDHDDAVFVEPASGGDGSDLRLWVAIADVSHFVEEGGALDREALRRGNSVYLPDRAIPMLPESLSSQACSLVAGEDRLVLAVELIVAADGQVRDRVLQCARIRSRARLSYEQAAAAMEGISSGSRSEVATELHEPLRRLAELAERLRRRRLAHGSIEFELPEAQLEFDEKGWPVASRRSTRSIAHRAIEEAMLAANRAVAGWLAGRSLPAVHRIHEAPGKDALEALAGLLARFGLVADANAELTPARLASALAAAVGRPIERLVHWTTLRSMQQARYSIESLGHYALGFDHYLHFTSPIRRVADLAVHRAVHRSLAGEVPPVDAMSRAERVAVRGSLRERLAQQVEREARAIKQAALMQAHLGERFEGHVSGLTDDSVFVTLDDPFVDGRLEAARLAAGFRLEPDGLALVARGGKHRIALGDPISVQVEAADAFRGRIALGPVAARQSRSSSASSSAARRSQSR